MRKTILIATLLLTGRLSAQCPYFVSCQPDSLYCDYTNNDPLLWAAAPFTWNPGLMLSDLPEGEMTLRMSALDSCGNQNLSVEYTLFLDLDGNDTAETVIQSNLALPSGKVLFNNILSPNYAQGDTLAFDLRPGLPDSMRYRFGLKLQHIGDSVVAQLMWTTGIANLNYSVPQLPLGKHRILWRVEQGGGAQVCESSFELKDCAPPVVTCLGNLSVNIMPTGLIQLWASNFVQSASDNITPSNQLVFAVRLPGMDSGFPLDDQGNPQGYVTFNCCHVGTRAVELWVRDQNGLVSSCNTYIIIQDNFSNCGSDFCGGNIIARAKSESDGIEDVLFQLDGMVNYAPPFSYYDYSDSGGYGQFFYVPINSNLVLTPSRIDNPLNGVSTYDLVLISKHILAIDPLSSPFKMIAADANKSGSITSFDILELRKLILGIYDTLPNNTSWRFVAKDFQFPNAQNPFQTVFPEKVLLQDWTGIPNDFEFTGLKVGDVNNSAIPNCFAPTLAENRAPSFLTIPEIELQANQVLNIPVYASENATWSGLQFSLDFDPEMLEIEAIESTVFQDFDQNNWAQPQPGRLNLSWSAASTTSVSPELAMFQWRVKARRDLKLSSVFKVPGAPGLRPEAYDTEGLATPLQIVFTENDLNETLKVFAPQPNPTHAGVILPVQLFQAEKLQVEVRDITGKLCWNNELSLDKGNHTLQIPAAALDDPGVYFWSLQVGKLFESGKIIKI
jgi:hypothetical protein